MNVACRSLDHQFRLRLFFVKKKKKAAVEKRALVGNWVVTKNVGFFWWVERSVTRMAIEHNTA